MPKGPQGQKVASPLWQIWLVAAALVGTLGVDLFEQGKIPNGIIIIVLFAVALVGLIWRRHAQGS